MMPSVELLRLEENYEYGTFGVLKLNKQILCVTLEPRDEENAKNISSIPAQQYICKLTRTGLACVTKLGFNDTYEVIDVPGRYLIKFHPGTSFYHTLGCILIAEKFGKFMGDRVILNSGETYKMFRERMKDYNEFLLTISEHY